MSVAAKRQTGHKVKFGFPMKLQYTPKQFSKKLINALILYNKTFMQIFFIIFFQPRDTCNTLILKFYVSFEIELPLMSMYLFRNSWTKAPES